LPVDPAGRRKREQPDPVLLAEVTDFNPENAWIGERVAESGSPRTNRGPSMAETAVPSSVVSALASTAVPDFYGQGLRAVVERAISLGLEVEPRGTGVARRQSPAPGSPVPDGARVTVEFER